VVVTNLNRCYRSEATYESREAGEQYVLTKGPDESGTVFEFGGGTEILFKDLPGFAISGDVRIAKQFDVIQPRILVGARYYFCRGLEKKLLYKQSSKKNNTLRQVDSNSLTEGALCPAKQSS
jgi:hypothetical protein